MEQPKILLGILTYKYVSSTAFSSHMATLLDGINAGLVKNLVIQCDMYVTMARNNLCLAALQLQESEGITHLLMIDDDMIVPPGSIEKLALNDVPVIGGAYYTRDARPVAYAFDPFEFLEYIPGEGVIPVGGTGGGFLLISCDLLRKMQDKYKDTWWFQSQVERDPATGKEAYLGEDVFFFKRLREMQIQAYLDCNVQLGHAGTAICDRRIFEISKAKDFKEKWGVSP